MEGVSPQALATYILLISWISCVQLIRKCKANGFVGMQAGEWPFMHPPPPTTQKWVFLQSSNVFHAASGRVTAAFPTTWMCTPVGFGECRDGWRAKNRRGRCGLGCWGPIKMGNWQVKTEPTHHTLTPLLRKNPETLASMFVQATSRMINIKTMRMSFQSSA